MCTNQSNAFNEKQAVFEEINRWQRYLTSTLWIITSFFISLNLLIIREAMKCPINNVVERSVVWGFVFTILCILEWALPTSLIIITLKVAGLVENKANNVLHIDNFTKNLAFKWRGDFFNEKFFSKKFFSKKVGEAVIKPWGIINTAFTLVFISTWWILIYK